MTTEGRRLFVNAVFYSLTHSRCVPPTPPPNCLTLTKTAVPASGTPVTPGQAIKYTLTYTVSQNPLCDTVRSELIDHVPDFSLFVPGSATDGISPNFANTLIWNLGPLAHGTTGSKSFTVSVLDTGCREQLPIRNIAKLQTNLGVFVSNITTHPVTCPPVVPPNNDPPYAESEIQVYPYPLVTGQPTQFSVRVFNNSATSQTVTVTFQTSPNQLRHRHSVWHLPVPGQSARRNDRAAWLRRGANQLDAGSGLVTTASW